MPTCHCLRDRYLCEGTSVSSLDVNIFWCSVSRRNSPIYETACRYCVLWFWAVLLCTVVGSVNVEISTAMVTCLSPLQQLIGFAHSRLTLRHSASHSAGASPLLPLPLTLPHPEEKSRARSTAEIHTLIQLSYQIPVPDQSGQIHFLLALSVWIMFG